MPDANFIGLFVMNNNLIGSLIFIAICVACLAFVIIWLFRYVMARLGMQTLLREGVNLTENGIEVPGLFYLYKKRIRFEDIRSARLLSFASSLPFLYKISVWRVITRTSSALVAIELSSPPQIYQYILATPSNPKGFVEQLESRLERIRGHPV